MSPQARNRFIAIAALLVAGGGLAVIALGNLGENLVYYWSPGELLGQQEKAHGPTIRLGGIVKPGSIAWDAAKTELNFQMADDHKPGAPVVAVHSREVPPQMFRDGIGVIVEGTYSRAGVFESNRLMVNHSNEYRKDAPDGGHEYVKLPEGQTEASATPGTGADTTLGRNP